MRTLLCALALLPLCSVSRAQESDRASAALVDYLKSLPATDIGKHGHPGSALTLVFIGTKAQIRYTLKRAAWTGVPRRGPVALIEGLGQLAAGVALTKFPPFHSYRVEGRKQDANYAQVVHALTKRHHFRLWRLAEPDPQGRPVWWGSASYDTGVRWKLFIPVTHNTDPDIAAERDYIARTLAQAPGIARLGLVDLPQIPRQGINDQNDHYVTDGKALVVEFGQTSGAARAESPDDGVFQQDVLSEGQ